MSLRFCLMSILLISISACASKKIYIDDVYNNARDAYSRNQYEQARMYYKKFVNDNPGNPLDDVALYHWGDSARESGRLKEAEEVFNLLVERHKEGFWVELAQKDLKSIHIIK